MFKINNVLQDTLSCHGDSFGAAEARQLKSHEKRIKELEDHVGLSQVANEDKTMHSEGQMTVEAFLGKDYLFVEGDSYKNLSGEVYVVGEAGCLLKNVNFKSGIDSTLYIISAKALEQTKPIETVETKTKVEYILCDNLQDALTTYENKEGHFCSDNEGKELIHSVRLLAKAYGESSLYLAEEKSVEWYDNIPEGGVLCWVWKEGTNRKSKISKITEYSDHFPSFIIGRGCGGWENATPLTKQEVEVFLGNVPE